MFARAAGSLWRRTYTRYMFASVVALGVDTGLFLLLLDLNMAPTAASILGYGAGIGAHWLFSSRTVFVPRIAYSREARARQKALFLGSALVGLAITATLVGFGQIIGADPRLAKFFAIVLSFNATYLLRKTVVFPR